MKERERNEFKNESKQKEERKKKPAQPVVGLRKRRRLSRGFAASVGSTSSLPRPGRVTLPACKTDCHRTTTNQGQSINQSGLE